MFGLLAHRRQRGRGEPGPSSFAVKVRPGCDEILRHEMAMNPVLEPRPFAHDEPASPEQPTPLTRLRIWDPDGGGEMDAQQLDEFARIDRIGLGARLPAQLDVKGVRDLHRDLIMESR